MRTLTAAVALTALALGLSGCAGPTQDAHPDEEGKITVVASTDVWGDIAAMIGGEFVHITSLITGLNKDPHDFEASARDQLALSEADLVIENGGGYDDFINTMLDAARNPDTVVLNAVEAAGVMAPEGEELNEHVWYDFAAVKKVAAALASAYTALDASHGEDFQRNASDLTAKLDSLAQRAAAVAESHSGTGVAITEPVPLYLLSAMGLINQTPEEFSEAVEEGTDVAPAVLLETLKLFSEHEVGLLVYNSQTSGPETSRLLQAAEENGIPSVPVTENLPPDTDYVTWMTDNIDSIESALAG